MAATHVALFGVAAIFSSEVSKAAGNETLIRGERCGDVLMDQEADDKTRIGGMSTVLLNRAVSADAYARSCYGSSQKSPECNLYTVRQIEWRVSCWLNVDCIITNPSIGRSTEMPRAPLSLGDAR